MRDGAGTAIDRDDRATPAPTDHASDLAPRAALILTCKRCGSHFEQDLEEVLCWRCIEWAELLERCDSYAHAVRGGRGGRS